VTHAILEKQLSSALQVWCLKYEKTLKKKTIPTFGRLKFRKFYIFQQKIRFNMIRLQHILPAAAGTDRLLLLVSPRSGQEA
jgi:hypothetical protein